MSRYDVSSDVEPPGWSSSGGSCTLRGSSGGQRGRNVARYEDSDDPLAGLKMPDLPIPRTAQVMKYIRYFTESHEGRKNFAEALRRSGRFQEIIAKAFRELGLPQSLIAVAFIESGFSTEALSTAGALGLWQFMPATGRAYGLTIESSIDERASIWRSTEAAARHLADLYERFRSWELALGAYNLGFEGLDRRLDEYETEDFWTLAEAPGALPKETAHYVPKVLAAAVVFENVDEFGFSAIDRAPPIDASELEVGGGTRLSVVARAAGTSLRVLRELNPELLADIVPDRGETATVHVPRSGLARARTMLSKLASESEEQALQVSDDFDWGKDDVRSGRSRLERTSTRSREARARRRARERAAAETAKAKIEAREREAQTDPHETEPSRETEAPREIAPSRRATPSRRTTPSPEMASSRETEPSREAAPSRETQPPRETEASRETEPSRGTATKFRAPIAHERTELARVFYRVVAGDSIQQIAATVGLTVEQLLAQARVASAADIKVGTLLDLRVPAATVKSRPTGPHFDAATVSP